MILSEIHQIPINKSRWPCYYQKIDIFEERRICWFMPIDCSIIATTFKKGSQVLCDVLSRCLKRINLSFRTPASQFFPGWPLIRECLYVFLCEFTVMWEAPSEICSRERVVPKLTKSLVSMAFLPSSGQTAPKILMSLTCSLISCFLFCSVLKASILWRWFCLWFK